MPFPPYRSPSSPTNIILKLELLFLRELLLPYSQPQPCGPCYWTWEFVSEATGGGGLSTFARVSLCCFCNIRSH